MVAKTADIWHERYDHINHETLRQSSSVVKGMEIEGPPSEQKCSACIIGKRSRQISRTPMERSNRLLALVHSDVLGPVQTPSHQGKLYYVSFIDDYSRYQFVYFLRHKSEVF